MERLTERRGEYVAIVGCKSLYGSEERKRAPASSAIALLAKYEDTGMTPDEIKTLLAERDAAISDLEAVCSMLPTDRACEFFSKNPCDDYKMDDCRWEFSWQWRGIGGNDGKE